MNSILQKLAGADRRSIGRSDEVVTDVLANPLLFKELFKGLFSDDLIIRMRSADAIEKITAQHPEYIRRYKRALVYRVAQTDQQEIRWHFAQMVPRLDLNEQESKFVIKTLVSYLHDKSSIVRTFSMQALADLAERNRRLRPRVTALLSKLVEMGTPAMKSRGRKLLRKLESAETEPVKGRHTL